MTATAYSAYDVCEVMRLRVLAALVAAGSDLVSTTYTAIGDVPWDDPCGQLTVAPVRVYRSSIFPQEDADQERCEQGEICVALSVLLIRCEPSLGDTGAVPTAAAMAAADRKILADAATVWNSVSASFDPLWEWERASVAQTPLTGEGGAIGMETTITIGIPYRAWCA